MGVESSYTSFRVASFAVRLSFVGAVEKGCRNDLEAVAVRVAWHRPYLTLQRSEMRDILIKQRYCRYKCKTVAPTAR